MPQKSNMQFITHGETNWKYILVAIIFAIIAVGGILFYTNYINKKIIFNPQIIEIKKIEKTCGVKEKISEEDSVTAIKEIPEVIKKIDPMEFQAVNIEWSSLAFITQSVIPSDLFIKQYTEEYGKEATEFKISNMTLSPDGQHIAVIISESDNEESKNVWVLSLQNNNFKNVTSKYLPKKELGRSQRDVAILGWTKNDTLLAEIEIIYLEDQNKNEGIVAEYNFCTNGIEEIWQGQSLTNVPQDIRPISELRYKMCDPNNENFGYDPDVITLGEGVISICLSNSNRKIASIDKKLFSPWDTLYPVSLNEDSILLVEQYKASTEGLYLLNLNDHKLYFLKFPYFYLYFNGVYSFPKRQVIISFADGRDLHILDPNTKIDSIIKQEKNPEYTYPGETAWLIDELNVLPNGEISLLLCKYSGKYGERTVCKISIIENPIKILDI